MAARPAERTEDNRERQDESIEESQWTCIRLSHSPQSPCGRMATLCEIGTRTELTDDEQFSLVSDQCRDLKEVRFRGANRKTLAHCETYRF
jgi:hypothetical protein